MVNKKYDEALFDAALEQAFTEAFKRDIAKIEEENKDMPEHPKKYVDMERAYYKKKNKPKMGGMLVFRKVAACVMAVLSVGFVTVLAVPDVRASVWDSAVGWFEKYTSISFTENNKHIQIGEFTAGYIPLQFNLNDTNISTMVHKFSFSNGVDKFQIIINTDENSQITFDNDHGEMSELDINGSKAYLIKYDDKRIAIIWKLYNYTFSIEGNISVKTMKKIAENIS